MKFIFYIDICAEKNPLTSKNVEGVCLLMLKAQILQRKPDRLIPSFITEKTINGINQVYFLWISMLAFECIKLMAVSKQRKLSEVFSITKSDVCRNFWITFVHHF